MEIEDICEIILSIPRVIYFNFRHLPLKTALKLPVWVHYKASVRCNGQVVILGKINVAMIRIGFHTVPAKDENDKTSVRVERRGRLVFKGTAHVGRGSKLFVAKGGNLILGNNFAISASSAILCYKRIVFGKDIQFSWDCLVMDSDTHYIYDSSGDRVNYDNEIIFGDKVWIGCGSLVLKGTTVPSNCVIGANSLVSGSRFESNSVIIGNPAKSVKRIGGWEI